MQECCSCRRQERGTARASLPSVVSRPPASIFNKINLDCEESIRLFVGFEFFLIGLCDV